VTYVVAALSVILFAIAFRLLGIASVAQRALQQIAKSAAALRTDSLTDDEKQAAMQQSATNLLFHFFAITGRSLVALAVPTVALIVVQFLQVTEVMEVVSFLSTWKGILISICVLFFVFKASPHA
jgi:hypothetical protein